MPFGLLGKRRRVSLTHGVANIYISDRMITAGWTVQVSPKRLIGTATFLVAFGAIVATESAFWRFVGNLAIVVPVAASSIVVTVIMIRRRGVALYRPSAALPARLKRWVRDEPDPNR